MCIPVPKLRMDGSYNFPGYQQRPNYAPKSSPPYGSDSITLLAVSFVIW